MNHVPLWGLASSPEEWVQALCAVTAVDEADSLLFRVSAHMSTLTVFNSFSGHPWSKSEEKTQAEHSCLSQFLGAGNLTSSKRMDHEIASESI